MSTFFTSDLHFHHSRIIELCNRPFSSAKEMDEILIQNWNGRVKPQDTVYFHGDLSWARTDEELKKTEEYLSRLNGREKIWILGNHDNSDQRKRLGKYFSFVTNYLEIRFNNTKYCLMHYPIINWNGCYKGSIMLHGHEHNKQISNSKFKIFDIGIDACYYTPIAIEEIEVLAKNKEIPNPKIKWSSKIDF